MTGGGARLVQIVLAAGRSSRMGEPKALLRFGERRAIEMVLDAAAGARVAKSVVVVSPEGESWRELPELAARAPEWVVNKAPEAHQIDSLARGLERVEELESALDGDVEGLFLHPVDFPLSTEDDYGRLAAALRDDTSREFDVFKPRFDGRHGHPVLIRRSLASRLIAAAGEGRTARDVIRASAVRSVEVAGPESIEDMDTPDDYDRLRARFKGRS